jgi:release factor glutamine methyltransferase
VAAARPDAVVVGTDLGETALQRARDNALRNLPAERAGGSPRWLQGHWWSALPPTEASFDLIVSNPPYIRDDDPHLEQGDLRFEPLQALASGPEGLDAITEIVSGAREYLRAGGWLLVEHGFDQGQAVRSLVAATGFTGPQTLLDAEGRERVTIGRNPGV